MSNRERYLIKANGDDISATKAGFEKFLDLCAKHGPGVIYVPTIADINRSLLAKAIGEENVKALRQGQGDRTFLPEGLEIKICADRTFKDHKRGSVYLGLWATSNMIDNIEKDAHLCKAIVVVTWLPKDSDNWIQKEKPILVQWNQQQQATPSY